jgi:predicted DNA-binding transcriptional regulator YafY
MTHNEIMQTLREACEEKTVCRIHLKGELDDRIIHPYGVCFSKKDKLLIVAFLASGYSESKNHSGYRNFLFENCERIELLDDTFDVDSDFNPFSDQYSGWLFHVLQS